MLANASVNTLPLGRRLENGFALILFIGFAFHQTLIDQRADGAADNGFIHRRQGGDLRGAASRLFGNRGEHAPLA